MNIIRKVDDNQKEIVEAFKKLGYSVAHTHIVGKGFPDIVVAGHDKRNYLIEIKDGKKPLSKRKLTPDELKFHDSWQGDLKIIESVEDVVRFVNENK